MTKFLGLAPKGVYLTLSCYQKSGELLPHHFTLTKKMAVYFLLHFPWGCPRRVLSGFGVLMSPDFPPYKGSHTTI